MSKLKMAFKEARKNNNIGLILPEFLSATFYVVGVDTDGDEKTFDFALTKSPNKNEMCVTASEDSTLVCFDSWAASARGGRELLTMIPKGSGVLVAYKSGGDYITSKQIDWCLDMLD